ncbi:MAG: LacI family DNA-binding transcriptional regulator, partial [Chloroflexota bacterium]
MSTVREIAEYAGVSKSTVSLVLNNKSGVSDEMRQTVLNAVDELNSLRTGTPVLERTIIERGSDMKVQAHTIMVLHPPVLRSSYVFGQVLQGIQSVAEMNKLQLRLVVNDPKASSQHVSHLYLTDDYLRPDGALMFGAQKHELLLDKVVEQGIPCVVLGREVKRYDVSGIERDETRYAYQLTQHLIELGHRSIVFAGGDQRYDFTHTRLLGYQL